MDPLLLEAAGLLTLIADGVDIPNLREQASSLLNRIGDSIAAVSVASELAIKRRREDFEAGWEYGADEQMQGITISREHAFAEHLALTNGKS